MRKAEHIWLKPSVEISRLCHLSKNIYKRKRGLFRTEKGRIVNADVNGALNIIRKAVPDASFLKVDGVEGAVSHPVRLIV